MLRGPAAFPAMVQAFKPIIPYILVIIGVLAFYSYVLDVGMDEFSAPRILPVIMLGIWGSSGEVAIYNAAARVSMLISFVFISINIVLIINSNLLSFNWY